MLKKGIQKVANSLGYKFSKVSQTVEKPELQDYPCIDLLDLVMQDYIEQKPDIFVIQIGAHDGQSADPTSRLIRKYHWSGILVEPLPETFKQLVKSYQGEDQLIFEQAAIDNQDGTVKFYTISDEVSGLPFWVSQSSSTEYDKMYGALYYWKNVKKIKSIPDDFERLIREISVPSVTTDTLLSKHNIQSVDLLSTATPGFDYNIIKAFPFDRIKPPNICFEYLTMNAKDRKDCLEFLAALGYRVGRFAPRAIASLNAPILSWTLSDY